MKVLAQPDYNTRCVRSAKEKIQEHHGAQCPSCDPPCKENAKKATGEVFPAFSTGAVRENKTGKGRCDLLPMCALIRLSKHFEAGTEAHGERNWELGIPIHSFIDSALRHLFKYVDGQQDEDHLVAAAWNIMCAMWTEEKKPEMQDIPTRKSTKHLKYPYTDPEEIVDG
jgi:hypothetical protein